MEKTAQDHTRRIQIGLMQGYLYRKGARAQRRARTRACTWGRGSARGPGGARGHSWGESGADARARGPRGRGRAGKRRGDPKMDFCYKSIVKLKSGIFLIRREAKGKRIPSATARDYFGPKSLAEVGLGPSTQCAGLGRPPVPGCARAPGPVRRLGVESARARDCAGALSRARSEGSPNGYSFRQ